MFETEHEIQRPRLFLVQSVRSTAVWISLSVFSQTTGLRSDGERRHNDKAAKRNAGHAGEVRT